MASHAREGHRAEGARAANALDAQTAPSDATGQSPLDFALALMRDVSKPDALRAGMAKAAMPYVHGRWCPVGSDPRDAKQPAPAEPISDLELARRVAHILMLGEKQQDAEAEAGAVTPVTPQASQPSRAGFAHETPHPPRWRSAPSPEGEGEGRSPSAPIWPDEARAQACDPYDPHPSYRWIP